MAQSLDLPGSNRIGNRQISIGRRHIVIDRGDDQVRPSHVSTSSAQTVECLRRSNFVNEMKIDIKQARLARRGAHNVCIPNFFEQCARHVLLGISFGVRGTLRLCKAHLAPRCTLLMAT